MIIDRDKHGKLHIVVGPKELENNLPALIAEALTKGSCFYDVDERADHVGELIFRSVERGRNQRTV